MYSKSFVKAVVLIVTICCLGCKTPNNAQQRTARQVEKASQRKVPSVQDMKPTPTSNAPKATIASPCQGTVNESEPNDSMETASLALKVSNASGSDYVREIFGLACPKEVDWYIIKGFAGIRTNFGIEFDRPTAALAIDIYTTNYPKHPANQVTLIGDLPGNHPPLKQCYVVYGDLYLKVHHVWGSSCRYHIMVSANPSKGPSEIEPNDTYDRATVISGLVIDGSINGPDKDWFQLQPSALGGTAKLTLEGKDLVCEVGYYDSQLKALISYESIGGRKVTYIHPRPNSPCYVWVYSNSTFYDNKRNYRIAFVPNTDEPLPINTIKGGPLAPRKGR